MTEVQKVSFDLLCQFVEICNKLDLKYYLVCGSALGAVKYGGFIPWDDDVDVAMLRQDYERFLAEAPALLPGHLALQNIHTKKAFPLLMTKLVNTETTLIEKQFLQLPIHHGIFLDIFPLDGYPQGKGKEQFFELRKWIYNKMRCFAYLYGYRLFNLSGIMHRYERLLKKYSCSGSALICNHGNWQGKLEYSPAEEFGMGKWSSFEGLAVRIPENYHSYFSRKYGAWQEELPQDEQVSHHDFLKCDPTCSYKSYLYKSKGKIRVRDEHRD